MEGFRTQDVTIKHQPKITLNRARCKKCGTVITSTHRHDWVSCKCSAIFVDGGNEYLRRGGNLEDIEELSEEK